MNKHTDELLDAVQEIAEVIWMEMPLRYQDQWLENIMAKGMWRPDPEVMALVRLPWMKIRAKILQKERR